MTDQTAHPTGPDGKPVALETRAQAEDGRRYSPSIARNREAVREVYLAHMPREGEVLEIASGTGEHGAFITEGAPALNWTYSDVDADSRVSQQAWIAASGHVRLRGPLTVDTTASDWGEAERAEAWDGMFCANLIHIAPFEAAAGLLTGAGRGLRRGGRLMLYGPFAVDGEIAPSNAQFSADLKRRDPRWGVRDLVLEVLPLAQSAGLSRVETIAMPANNLSVIFERT